VSPVRRVSSLRCPPHGCEADGAAADLADVEALFVELVLEPDPVAALATP
jgi:hypothetical protein